MYKKQKVNVILDTNIWLYLSNGSDQLSDKVSKNNLHFTLLKELKEKQSNEEITILITDINLIEWERNKHHTQALVQRRKNRILDIQRKFEVFKRTNSSDKIEEERRRLEIEIANINVDIESNIRHIESVEAFLKNDCKKVPISEATKLRIWDMAINKAIPLHTDKNNIADASILLSTIEYMSSTDNKNYATVFISNNSKDFCVDKNSSEFHPDLKKLIGYFDLRFEKKLDKGLEISEAIQIDLDEFAKERYYDNISFECKSKFCVSSEHFTAFGYLEESAIVISEYESKIDPNQLSLFPDEKPKVEPEKAPMGYCTFCGSLHIECPGCGELIADVEIGDEFSCLECQAQFLAIYSEEDGGVKVIVKDEQTENDLMTT